MKGEEKDSTGSWARLERTETPEFGISALNASEPLPGACSFSMRKIQHKMHKLPEFR
jgi:hypothetical protein